MWRRVMTGSLPSRWRARLSSTASLPTSTAIVADACDALAQFETSDGKAEVPIVGGLSGQHEPVWFGGCPACRGLAHPVDPRATSVLRCAESVVHLTEQYEVHSRIDSRRIAFELAAMISFMVDNPRKMRSGPAVPYSH